MNVNERECKAAGLSVDQVRSIANRISKVAREAEKLGLHIFGGASGSLRFADEVSLEKGDLVVASLDGSYCGGDGGTGEDEDGLLRGEA